MSGKGNGTLELTLANGKTVKSDKGEELACFLASQGSSIIPVKGGKSKGARGRGRKTARQPRAER